MDWIEKQLSHARTPNAIVHLGAGLCSELEIYLLHKPGQIFLVEPNPEVLPELRRRAQDQRVSVIPVAISGREGRQALRLFNYPDLASLRQPTGLIELLPGLRQTGQAIVDVLAAQDLPKCFQIEADEDNWLIIDTPGEEFAILECLAKHEQLQYFDRIVLKAGAESLYEDAQSAEDIVAYLQRRGYFGEGAPDNADADWPRLHFRLNPKALECRRLEYDNRKLQEQLKEARETDAKRSRELALAQENQAEVQANFKAQLESSKKQFEEQAASLQAEKKELDQQRAALEEKLRESQAEAERLKGELNASASRKDQELDAMRASHESLEKELETANAELEKQRNDLGIALRLQSLREADLNELQGRYGELQEVKSQQEVLLGKLHQRLSVAADFLRLESDGSNPEHVREELARALSGEQAERK